MAMDSVIIEEAGSIVLAIGGSSVSGTIPPNFERVAIVASGNAHWRMGKGAQTAVATDPMVCQQQGLMIVKVKPTGTGLSDTFAVIQDGTATGNVSVFGVRES